MLFTHAIGGGVAAFKEQEFHSDASASIMVYTELVIGSAPFIKIKSGTKVATIDRKKLAGSVEVLSSLPDNITNETELKPLIDSLSEVNDFTIRFPKSSQVLQGQIKTLERSIERFNSGQVRYNREWMTNAQYASIQEEKDQQQEKARQADAAMAAERQKLREEQEAFADAQRARGLELYGEKWLPKDEVANLLQRDRENLSILNTINDKSVTKSVYSVFQVSDDGMLIRFHSGTIKQGGINTSIAYLFGVASGTAADGDYYKGDLYWCGSYSYINTLGTQNTVNAYCLKLSDAIERVRVSLYGSTAHKGGSNAGQTATESSNSIPDPIRGASSSGSGFFVGNMGYFITNAHVIENAGSITILHNNKKLEAEVIKVSKVGDLAILKVDQPISGLPISLEEAEPGQDAYALGFPQPAIQGLDIKITKGIISSGKGIGDDDTRFQIDTPVQPGNSGGPLCDKSGKLIGVVVARLNEIAVANRTGSIPQNVNYAIKATEVTAILRSKSVDFDVVSNDDSTSGIKRAAAATGLVIVRD